jgi:hypothetical protein
MRCGQDRAEIEVMGKQNVPVVSGETEDLKSGAFAGPRLDQWIASIPESAKNPIQFGDRFISTRSFMPSPA